MKRVPFVLPLLAAVLLATPVFAQEAATLPSAADPGRISAVTVYRGQALVTRDLKLDTLQGLREIVVKDLPPRVIPASLYAESGDNVEVRSVLYRERPVPQDVRADVRTLDDKIKALGDTIAGIQRSQQVLREQHAYLDKLETFVAPTATTELTKGVLNAETLKTLTSYVFEQRRAIADQSLKLEQNARDRGEELAVLQRQRAEIAAGSARTDREAVLLVNIKAAAPGNKLQVVYMVDGATWDPSYIIRADGKGKVTMEYNAAIQQLSGEDWKNVKMTLSTATPSLAATAPTLTPLTVSLAATDPSAATRGMSYDEIKADFAQKRREADNQRQILIANSSVQNYRNGKDISPNGSNVGLNVNADQNLNDIAGQEQLAELLAHDGKQNKGVNPQVARRAAEVISVTYDLASATTLPSRSDRQLIQIASVPVANQFYKLAAPVLTSYVYNQATLTNNSDKVFLAGPVASYMAGQFVGHGEIPTVAIGENFNVGFGIDPTLRASRERMDKTEVVQGGNKVVTYTYRIAIENFANAETPVRIMDRMPIARENTRDSDVKVTLDTASVEVSTNPDYLRTERKQGLLRWDVKVPAQALGDKAYTLDYKFKVEYDKQLNLISMTPGAEPAALRK